MSFSADSCLKRIRRYVEAAGYKEVSDSRIREACLINNFNPNNAANQLISEEQLKIYLEDMCVRLGYQPNKQFICTSCIKYKFKQVLVEEYALKLFKAKTKVKSECKKAKITTPEDDKLDRLIMYYFGNWQSVFHSIRQDL
jgi:hypothetical protein